MIPVTCLASTRLKAGANWARTTVDDALLFNTPDPSMDNVDPAVPVSWNAYAYTVGDPINSPPFIRGNSTFAGRRPGLRQNPSRWGPGGRHSLQNRARNPSRYDGNAVPRRARQSVYVFCHIRAFDYSHITKLPRRPPTRSELRPAFFLPVTGVKESNFRIS
jgi:hypothetical protein